MNNIAKRFSEINYKISMIEFKEHLTTQDYTTLDALREELEKCQKEMESIGGWVVKLSVDEPYYKTAFYLTGDPVLCCGGAPFYFESKEEAEDIYSKASISRRERYTVEYIYLPPVK